ncbi:M23 family metallopeptidase [Roseibium aggregatum]|uniref:M23 family metallopeptidase n=1 Tax=Roseibium aggregatum TaxID=187304 RepID=A0A926NYY4_9HYPH|nr:M23 family metallopeptidase [Roseibium aggregatum]MBD1546303.1 M23 family metallopeptidase [Roseibium aggregatum]
MKKRKRIVRSGRVLKVALVSVAAGILAGCSADVERFGEAPIYTGGTNNQRAILSGGTKQPTYQDIVNGPGGTERGLPPAASQPTYTGSVTKRSAVERASLPSSKPQIVKSQQSRPVETMPAPEVASSGAVRWKNWTSAGGTRVTVREGDTVDTISRRYGVPVEAIAAVNGIEYPGQVKPGQSLLIPTYVHPATASVNTTGKTASRPLYTGSVRPTAPVGGDTPSPDRKPVHQPSFAEVRSGKTSDTGPIHVAALPKRKPVTTTGSVRTASVQSVSGNVPVPPEMPAHNSNSSTPRVAVITTEKGDEARPTAPIKPQQQVASVEKSDGSGPLFRWPVRGRIISDFGSKPGGTRNEGVNLAVPEGTPVKAAGSGTVIYAGNELKGFGNLVLLRHADGWVSAYAHNSKLNVKRGDKVSRGEVIANAGATGSVSQPQVHFELRKGNKPVDPIQYLPKS